MSAEEARDVALMLKGLLLGLAIGRVWFCGWLVLKYKRGEITL